MRSVALAAIALTFLEPDPDTTWTEERITTARHRLAAARRPRG